MKKVLLLLCKGFEMYEAAAFHDVLGWPADSGCEAVHVVTVGLRDEVPGTFGIKIIPDKLLSAIDPENFDALAIPGGFEMYGFYEEAYSKEVADLICRFDALKKPIASICVGALPLAHSGILRGRQATTYHLLEGLRRKQLADFGAIVVDQPVVRDKNIITSTAPSTAMDVAFILLSELTGKENTEKVRYMMGFEKKGG